MRQSMTAFASGQGEGHGHGHSWSWELRGVNGKGLELRLRVPDWIDGLEAALRKSLSNKLLRGNIQLSLRLGADGNDARFALDHAHLDRVLGAMAEIETAARRAGVTVSPSAACDILTLRGVLSTDAPQADPAPLLGALIEDFGPVLDAFCKMRASEGAALDQIINAQLNEIENLVAEAADCAALRPESQAQRLRAQLARVMSNADGFDEARLSQELALLAVKSDITEEIDRLRAHVDAARSLMATPGTVGRKLDFLCQEFNREANTLCAKSGDAALTRIGLALKTVIDQMREQVQNVE